ncbi:calcineurin-like phosphoesterase family protein [bacterium]|nr:calcineurin-like phosphoesterase family protein [bacterium]
MRKSTQSLINLTILSVLLLAATGFGQVQFVSGVVFEDLNGNGSRDNGEPGIGDVLVSNQIDVVITDGDGRYQLPARHEMVVFVTQPVGYRVPVDEHQLPQFFYVHDEDGSSSDVNWKYEVLKPTGPLPASVDFPLLKEEHKNPFRMIAMADPQPRDDREIDYIREDVMPQMVNTEAEMAIVHGDIMFDDLSLFERQNDLFAQVGVPVWNVPGNHDMNQRSKNDYESMETFRRIFGPTYYSHDYADVHFMTLENVHYRGADYVKPEGGSQYYGFFNPEQLMWIENDLKHVPKDKLIVLSTHIPIKAFHEDHESVNTVNREELFTLLEGRKYLLLLAGHTHTNDHVYIGEEDGWHGEQPLHQHILGTVSGSWWRGPLDERGIPATTMRDGTENGYHIFTFDGTDYSSRFIPASMDEDYQIRILIEPGDTGVLPDSMYQMAGEPGNVLLSGRVEQATVVANVFNGGEKAQVTLRVDGGEPIPMQHTVRTDPYFKEAAERLKQAKVERKWRYWGNLVSSHIWTVNLPQGLQPGSHTVVVTAIDQYGQTLEGTKIFEVISR